MKGLKAEVRKAIGYATAWRLLGCRIESAAHLERAAELYRTAYYVYGARSRF